MHRNSAGVTVLELAVVLVTIGLLSGGILVGRDLLRSAQIQRQVAQLERYRVAFHAFELKYDCTPGDCAEASRFFSGIGVNGDGNGTIDNDLHTYYDNDNCFMHPKWNAAIEYQQFFLQLSAARLIDFTPRNPSSPLTGMPTLVLDGTSRFFAAGSVNFTAETTAGACGGGGTLVLGRDPDIKNYQKGQNALWLVACNVDYMESTPVDPQLSEFDDHCGTFVPFDLWSVDAKIDDGLPLSGDIFGFRGFYGAGAPNLCLNATMSEYAYSNSTKACQGLYMLN
ncbi:MAG: hypothetical protein L6R00_10195 [Phycisphaerae bacterium]|nr:hypothetical protein [Phycisphaerae bacterium]